MLSFMMMADLTRRPERPIASTPYSRAFPMIVSAGTLMPRLTTWYPLLERMMSTRFFPMSWTSPATVASRTFRPVSRSALARKGWR
jgi:hypothetical protein